MLQNNRGYNIKGAFYNQINLGLGVQVELLAVTELLTVTANEKWILNVKIVVFVRSNQVKAWLNRKEDSLQEKRVFVADAITHKFATNFSLNRQIKSMNLEIAISGGFSTANDLHNSEKKKKTWTLTGENPKLTVIAISEGFSAINMQKKYLA